MKQIPLTQGKFALVDDEDYDYLMQWKWQAQCHHGNYYARRSSWVNGVRFKVSMHRLLLGINDPRTIVDHKDRNGLNNQKTNLRPCTLSENAKNRKSTNGSTSIFLGVYVNNTKKTYMTKRGLVTNQKTVYKTKIQTPKKELHLGTFPYTKQGEIDAAKAYDRAAIIYHGEFANLNFKNEP